MPYLKQYLSKNPNQLVIFASLTAFLTYLCFYPFRRAYTAATYEDLAFFGVNFKILMITAQVLGFAVSKGIGIKVVSEMNPAHRSRNMLLMIGLSWICYLFFALVPPPYNLFFIFLANLPLGLFYGTILGFLEGRRVTDLLVAMLTASFIVGSGFAKSIGKWVMDGLEIGQFWMPFVAGAVMLIPITVFINLLGQIPPPDAQDLQNRTERKPMSKADRKAFISQFLFGIILFTLSYVILTTFREFRDNFAPEMWKSLGSDNSKIFTQTEIPIAITVLLIMASMRWVKENYKAYLIIEILMLFGGVLIGLSTLFFQQGWLSPFWWITCLGLGVYLSYSMSNSLYFERMIASFKQAGTVGFLITFADYYAYFGSIFILFYKNFFQPQINYLDFFIYLSYGISVIYTIIIGLSIWYFHRRFSN